MPRQPKPYQLTAALLASSVGSGVLCLAAGALGQTFRLHAERPGASLNRTVRADLPSGAAHVIEAVAKPALVRVDISGPIEQRAGYHDPCGGWTDGNDAICERLCAAFAEGDVELVGDTPGGAAAGVQQGVQRVLAAKAKYGRRCTGFANEQVGSLGMWWMLAVCDELFIPAMGQLGSIGARRGHLDVSEAMAKNGERLTYFTWPDEGKIAFAPERPLSEIGKARGDRDVALAGEAFCAAVCGSPIGLRYGLDRAAVMALSADMLTGQAAVDAGLCDGIATEEEVTAYALKLAEAGARGGKDSGAQARARGVKMKTKAQEEEEARARAGSRAEDDDGPPPSSKPGEKKPEGEEPGRDIPTKCATCGVENPKEAKFCMGCAASMGTAPVQAEEDGGEDAEDMPPPSSKPRPGALAPVARRNAGASFAEILGLSADASVPAQKAALLDVLQVFDHAASLTGSQVPARILGGLTAISKDASATGRMRAERDQAVHAQAKQERWALAHRLVKCGGAKRGAVFLDSVSTEGKRTGVKLSPVYAEMKLETLKGLVLGHETNAKPRDPFEPSREAAKEASAGSGEKERAGNIAAAIEIAKKNPSVRKLAAQTGRDVSVVAAAWVKNGGAS